MSAQLFTPRSVVVDEQASLYIGDVSNNRVRKVDAVGVITTLAGGATNCGACFCEPDRSTEPCFRNRGGSRAFSRSSAQRSRPSTPPARSPRTSRMLRGVRRVPNDSPRRCGTSKRPRAGRCMLT
jgi:hypothetical protein